MTTIQTVLYQYYDQFVVPSLERLTPDLILNLVVGCLWICFVWEFYLSWRQYRVYVKTDKIPQEIESIMDQETLTKARLYNIDKSLFKFVYSFYSQALVFVSINHPMIHLVIHSRIY